MNKTINQLLVTHVGPLQHSSSTWGEYRTVKLLDPDDNFKEYITYIDHSNQNYHEWHKIFEEDFNQYAFLIKGAFKIKRNKFTREGKPIINGDAVFRVVSIGDRDDVLEAVKNMKQQSESA